MKHLNVWLVCSTVLIASCTSHNATVNTVNPKIQQQVTPQTTDDSRITTGLAARSDVMRFIEQTHASTGLDKKWLTDTMNKAAIKPTIVDAMNRPAERKNWGQYRPIFITEKRINDGVQFFNQYRSDLLRAEAQYGVDASIIAAIIGVETSYGANRGNWSVVDALATLSFEYPRRASFFSRELKNFLLIANQMNQDPFSFKGSYAGAMGYPQFMPSSYLAYAIDFDGDGVKDLWNNPTDAIGSVANYLAKHGWQRDGLIVTKADVNNPSAVANHMQKNRIEPLKTSLSTLKSLGVQTSVNHDGPVALMQFELSPDNYEYWIGFKNFYAITRYNQSNMYALAVAQLADAIEKRK